MTTLMAGAAETVITSIKDRPDVYAELYARVLVLADGEKQLAIVTADYGQFSLQYNKVLLEAIQDATGIPPAHVVINCSHTHNAPGVDGREMSEASEAWLATCLADLVKDAVGKLEPATLRVGRAPVQVGYNRRIMNDEGYITMAPNPEGPVVPWVDVLGAYDVNGDIIAVLFSHAAHPVIVHWSSEEMGADFPGYAVEHLRNFLELKPKSILLFAQGCAADINGYPLRGGFEACDVAGFTLAFATHQALKTAKDIPPAPLKACAKLVSLPFRDPPSVAECEQLIEEFPDDERYVALLEVAKSGEKRTLPFPISAFAVGDALCFLSVSHELFSEYQLFADETSPFSHTFVFGYTNGSEVYIATRAAYELGLKAGYEAGPRNHALSGPYRLALLSSVEEQIRAEITNLLGKLKEL
ncbi:hypothetical protein F4X88_18670 [Candidatus Poribacteria bacterium]|nr:hypothetical protein [Candidatus Poribacteria bacterium]MYA58313.1 hypothetical protein [Candidatus Poribacteria bacterium]